jgi:asparagine synthase (glutamine-hydrolysing)
MCGIAGIVSMNGSPVLEQELRNMSRAMVHRGPDDDGIYLDGTAGLTMRRLSIIDIDGGHQPFHNEDRTVWVVFNGEIYNFQELRRALEAQGHVLSTRSDTEVIVHLYEQHGTRCVEHLRGMFGFALWDTRRKSLLLARDRLGIKPLYYAEAGGRVVFASELKSILQLPDIECSLSWRSVSHLFTFLTTPPAESIVEGIRKIEPGQLLIASPGRAVRTERYWDLKFEPDYKTSAGEFVERTREILSEAVRLHMVSDVPVGAFLSGGIDSSAVVASAARSTTDPIKTFSIGFREASHDESSHARQVAAAFGTDHHELSLGPESLDELTKLAWHLDEPFGDSSAIPTYMVSKLAARHVKVVLSGDGGDELFAGYDRYLREQRERTSELPRTARRIMGKIGRRMPANMRGRAFLRHHALVGDQRYLDSAALFRHDDLCGLFRPEVSELLSPYEPWKEKAAYISSQGGHWLSRLQRFDLANYLPLDILTKVDRMSMAHSIETRVPLLDHKLVEFAATIPPEWSLSGSTTKVMLKRAMRGILPDSIIDRPKHGFAIPLGYWFRGKLGGYARDVLLGQRAKGRGLFETRAVERLIERHEKGRELDLQIWTLLSFELWLRTFYDVHPGRYSCAVA